MIPIKLKINKRHKESKHFLNLRLTEKVIEEALHTAKVLDRKQIIEMDKYAAEIPESPTPPIIKNYKGEAKKGVWWNIKNYLGMLVV